MTDIFDTAKASICNLSSEMIDYVRTSLGGVVRNLLILKTEKPDEQNKSTSRNTALSIVSIASLVTGGIGIVCGASWAKWLLVLGAGSVGIDYCISHKKTSIRRDSSFEEPESKSLPLSERYKIIDILTTFSDEICVTWDNKLGSIKESLLKSVADSNAPEDKKVKANYELYVVNRISYSMTDWLPRFEATGDKSLMVELISQYGAYITGQIEEAYNKQSLAYTAAENILKD